MVKRRKESRGNSLESMHHWRWLWWHVEEKMISACDQACEVTSCALTVSLGVLRSALGDALVHRRHEDSIVMG